ncbi:hypothetical protein [Rhodoplanes serenus]|uniref:hypothetical protein n=1 Tax=Rhodoplanes serenus TaxID=200615 RepID=UPI000DAD45CE|nr:hypothetical protein [Rhodoplanes serenus]RAI34515.1 hypothetical protein CH340_08795 [Rhodoplanes serenus]
MAHIAEPCVRETTETTGTSDLVLLGPMQGSFSFEDFMAPGDTCDAVVSYGAVREAFRATLNPDGSLARTAVQRAKHANGAVNTTKVTLPAGIKTVIMTVRPRVVPRVDVAQTYTSDERARHRANVPPFESGTKMLFQQTTPPVGWTKLTTHNDKALRIVSGSVGSGGTSPFSTVFGRTATDGRTLTASQLASHQHGVSDPGHDHSEQGSNDQNVGITAGSSTFISFNKGVTAPRTGASGTGISIQNAGGGASHDHPIEMRVQYVDCIIAEID